MTYLKNLGILKNIWGRYTKKPENDRFLSGM